MKISKIAIAVLFTAGFLTTSASASMATSCAEGYVAVEGVFPDPMYTCEPIEAVEAVEGEVEVKPIDSCWTTEDGSDVCARGVPVPMTVTSEEETPVGVSEENLVGGGDCTVSVDADGNELNACYDAVPYEATGEEGEVMPLEEGTVDETLMFQSGIAKSGAMPSDQTASNTLAAFGVLVGALGAFGIAISRERAAK
ncbi:MAG: hypothetical protein RLZZ606_524 [Actinomycetota bacterium]|jgi:hypothetical protein